MQVIHGLDVDVADGTVVVQVGPSGCGKPTLLRMIAGLEGISAGTIPVGDRLVNALPPAERDSAMVFRNCALYPHKTVAANMALALRMRRMRRMDRAEIETRKCSCSTNRRRTSTPSCGCRCAGKSASCASGCPP